MTLPRSPHIELQESQENLSSLQLLEEAFRTIKQEEINSPGLMKKNKLKGASRCHQRRFRGNLQISKKQIHATYPCQLVSTVSAIWGNRRKLIMGPLLLSSPSSSVTPPAPSDSLLLSRCSLLCVLLGTLFLHQFFFFKVSLGHECCLTCLQLLQSHARC